MTGPRTADGAGTLGDMALDVLESAPIGMLLTRGDGEILWANAAMKGVLGIAPTALLGSDFSASVHPGDRELLAAETATLLAHPRSSRPRDLRWVDADGSVRWLTTRTSAVDGARGAGCVIRQFSDITDRKTTESRVADLHQRLMVQNDALVSIVSALEKSNLELERSNEELAQFAYVASHDLSEPLRVISGHVELLRQRYADQLDATADEWISFAVDGCSRMRTLIDDLLRYSRAGSVRPTEDVDLEAVIGQVRTQLAVCIADSGATITALDLPVVLGDRTGLTQVLGNLVSNSLKYCHAEVPPVVTVTAARVASGWQLDVSDNGIGIPAHQRERVFRIFQRLHGRDVPGTGIGLAISRKVVERHGGVLTLSANPDGGTTASFTLPDTRSQHASHP